MHRASGLSRGSRPSGSPSFSQVRVRRLLIGIGIGLLLTWAILTKSLPFVLAETHPEFALRLDPENPVALLTLAERARTRLVALTLPAADVATVSKEPGLDAADALPPVAETSAETATEAEQLREEIRVLARRVIASDPLNARSFRLLGELSDAPETKRLLMKSAFSRSRREPIAGLWLMADSFEQKDYAAAVARADILLRTDPARTAEVMRYLAALGDVPEGRTALVAALVHHPAWRLHFFEAFPKQIQYAGTPFELVLALNEAGSAPSPRELAPYLRVLMRQDLIPYAHDIWLQLPGNHHNPVPLLNNANFNTEPSGLPFDWLIQRGGNASVEFAPLVDGVGGRSLQFSLDGGRVRFPELSQVLVLGPGRYRFSGELKGMVNGRRGLRWEIRCWRGKVLALTEMIYGQPREAWQAFALDLEVPDRDDCRSQQLRLFHDARSASEQLLSGRMTIRRLNMAEAAP